MKRIKRPQAAPRVTTADEDVATGITRGSVALLSTVVVTFSAVFSCSSAVPDVQVRVGVGLANTKRGAEPQIDIDSLPRPPARGCWQCRSAKPKLKPKQAVRRHHAVATQYLSPPGANGLNETPHSRAADTLGTASSPDPQQTYDVRSVRVGGPVTIIINQNCDQASHCNAKVSPPITLPDVQE